MAADDTGDDTIDKWQKANRLSLRCVVTTGDADPGPALAAAGIFDPVAIPVVFGDGSDPPAGHLGDGRTPNLIATLEFDQEDAFDASPDSQPGLTQVATDGGQPSGPVTTTAPAAFGMKSLAPICRSGDTGQRLHAEAEPYEDRARVYRSGSGRLVHTVSQSDAQGTNLDADIGSEPLNLADPRGP